MVTLTAVREYRLKYQIGTFVVTIITYSQNTVFAEPFPAFTASLTEFIEAQKTLEKWAELVTATERLQPKQPMDNPLTEDKRFTDDKADATFLIADLDERWSFDPVTQIVTRLPVAAYTISYNGWIWLIGRYNQLIVDTRARYHI